MIKKILSVLMIIPLLFTVFVGMLSCSDSADDGKLKIVCTVFPIYDWVRNIVATRTDAQVCLLVSSGTDLHSYQPTAQDMLNISDCDVLIYVGGESDSWVREAIASRTDPDRKDIELSKVEGVVLREMSAESGDHEALDQTHAEHDHGAIDEHIWLSIRNAAACVSHITDILCALDETGAQIYRENSEKYLSELSSLDAEYEEICVSVSDASLLVADRFPFVYLAEDYGIEYMAAFEGCSTETDATPETIIRLAQFADKEGVRYITVTESSDGKLAQSIIAASARKDMEIVTLDSMQSVTLEKAEAGESYLSIMHKNLNVLRIVLTK